jgi:hypothetical protein
MIWLTPHKYYLKLLCLSLGVFVIKSKTVPLYKGFFSPATNPIHAIHHLSLLDYRANYEE